MTHHDVGYFKKYEVKRLDGRQDPPDAEYFTFRIGPTIDPWAREALAVYAQQAEQGGNVQLAQDLRNILASRMTDEEADLGR